MAMWHSLKEMFGRSEKPPRPIPTPTRTGTGQNKRRTVRRAQRFAEGFIWSDRMAASKACSIRNLSVTGVRVDLLNGTLNPQTLGGVLTLYFPAEKREIDCKLMWRAGSCIGLEFVGSFRPPTRQYGSRARSTRT
jgi:hypothetical protein